MTSDKIESRNGAFAVEVGQNKSSKTALYPGSNSIISSEEPQGRLHYSKRLG